MKVGPSRKERLLWAFIRFSKFNRFNLNKKKIFHAHCMPPFFSFVFACWGCLVKSYVEPCRFDGSTFSFKHQLSHFSDDHHVRDTQNRTEQHIQPKNTAKKADKSHLPAETDAKPVQQYPNVLQSSLFYDKKKSYDALQPACYTFFVK